MTLTLAARRSVCLSVCVGRCVGCICLGCQCCVCFGVSVDSREDYYIRYDNATKCLVYHSQVV